MAFFGKTTSFMGLDIGTSSLKLVELVDRHKRIEVSTYAQANLPNMLVEPTSNEEDIIRKTANVVRRMMDKANVSTDAVIAALPNNIVFSTVLSLPNMPDEEIDKAVHFAARDVVPSDLDDMVLGWSRVGDVPHMDTDEKDKSNQSAPKQKDAAKKGQPVSLTDEKIPIFITAAPKNIVNRYLKLMEMLQLQLHALEVETFPLTRSLLESQNASGLIVDIGDWATTFHIIDTGAPRVSHTIDYGGHHITAKIAEALKISKAEAEKEKYRYGLSNNANPAMHAAVEASVQEMAQKAKSLLQLYTAQNKSSINKTVLIGGGANLKGLKEKWSQLLGINTTIGNPWKGLTVPQELEEHLSSVGSTYAVSVGLAVRGIRVV